MRAPWTYPGRACRDIDTNLFFPDVGGNGKEAIAICKTCPVIVQCLDYAMTHDEYGVWGGKTRNQRLHGFRTYECLTCGISFQYSRRGGSIPVACSAECRAQRKRDQARALREAVA
jgi:WhiB family redox-sensing transcriptional regulator